MEQTPACAPDAKGRVRNKRQWAAAALAVVTVAIGAYVAYTWNEQSTDDAQVEADVAPLSARTGSLVERVLVRENSPVKAGDIIMQLDEADHAVMVQQAEAELSTARAQAATAEAQARVVEASAKGGLQSAQASYTGSSVQVFSATAQIGVARATLDRAKSQLHQADIDLARAKTLAQAHAVTQERLDYMQTAYDEARSNLTQAQAQLVAADEAKKAAESHVVEARGRLDQSTPVAAQIASALAAVDLAHAAVASAQARLTLARLRFSYLKVRAPIDGTVSRLSAHDGQLLRDGQAVAEIVPLHSYVLANYKETQVARMKPGQQAKVTVDAYPGRTFLASVESLSGGTGGRFALLPADNAAGNFVKVVQRIPVRLAWKDLPPDVQMRAGMSVYVTVDTAR